MPDLPALSRIDAHLCETGAPDSVLEDCIAVRRAIEWQPIATAPKDGTPVLATNASYAYTLGRCAVVFWDDDCTCPGWHIPTDFECDAAHDWLTHWMPLPAPPQNPDKPVSEQDDDMVEF